MFYFIMCMFLSAYSPKLLQKSAVIFLSHIPVKYLKAFIQPKNHKISWKNCAQIFIKIGYPKNSLYINDLLMWLKDMNWPGAEEIFDYLAQMPKKDMMKYFENALKNAISSKDEDWVYSLSCFYNKNFNENDMLDKTILNEMKKIVNNY